MNDFTKEELEDLEEFLSDAPEFFDDSDGCLFNLHEKVKSMIDKYCEHEWENEYRGSIIIGIYCQKCARRLKGS